MTGAEPARDKFRASHRKGMKIYFLFSLDCVYRLPQYPCHLMGATECMAFFFFGGSAAFGLWVISIGWDTVRKAVNLTIGD